MGATPGGTYKFKVRATNADGFGPDSKVVSAKTRGGPPLALPAPTVGLKTKNLIQVKWVEPADMAAKGGTDLIGYRVYVREEGTTDTACTAASAAAIDDSPNYDGKGALGTSVAINGLNPGTSYTFKVTAINEDDMEGEQSPGVCDRTDLYMVQQ